MAYHCLWRVFCWVFIVVLAWLQPVSAEVDWHVARTLELDEVPIDMQADAKGRNLYILTDKGQLLIYENNGQFKDRIDVGKDVNGIKAGPRENSLYLLSAKAKAVRMINVDFIENIDIEGAPFKGPANAPVTVVVFSDFQCPYCSRISPVLNQIHEQYPKEVKIVFKQFPLRGHKFALPAARAAIAAAEQGKFWPFHDMLFENYSHLNDEKIEEIRKELKLDADKFAKTMASDDTKAIIDKDLADGSQAGVRGTPSVYVNGKRLRNKSFIGMRGAVDEALKRAK